MIDVILLAGGISPPESPLYPYTNGKNKATLDIGDKMMLQWVLDALEKSASINRIVIVGCEEIEEQLRSSKVIKVLPSSEDILMNFKSGVDSLLQVNPGIERVAVVTSDIPFITPESINWAIDQTQEKEDEVFYFVIDQETMESRFPNSNRSFTRLKDVSVCGGDLAVIKVDLITKKTGFWDKIIQARKSSLRQASLIGMDILLLLVLRRLSLEDAVDKVTNRLNFTGQGILCPYAEIGMDIDKPHQLELARRELGK